MMTNPLLNKDIRAKEIQSCRILIIRLTRIETKVDINNYTNVHCYRYHIKADYFNEPIVRNTLLS